MGHSTDNEPSGFPGATVPSGWGVIEPGASVEEDEGATEIMQQLDVTDFEYFDEEDDDCGPGSMDATEAFASSMAPTELLARTPHAVVPRRPPAPGPDFLVLGRIVALGVLVGMSLFVAGWWYLG